MPSAYILAVDDEVDFLRPLSGVLEKEGGYQVDKVTSGEDALSRIRQRRPDLLILDVMMPMMDGFEVCRRVRQDERLYDIPILFLTGQGDLDDVVQGFEAGGDDYVKKGSDTSELLARVRAVLRRGTRGAGSGNILQIGPVRLDADTYQVTVDGDNVQLTKTEYQLLRYMMEKVNQALSPQHLLEAVWDYPPKAGDPDLVRAHIRNLRAKLEINTKAKDFIRTIHSVGYMVAG
jgi:two-component system, OmpR family, response regulator RpaA